MDQVPIKSFDPADLVLLVAQIDIRLYVVDWALNLWLDFQFVVWTGAIPMEFGKTSFVLQLRFNSWERDRRLSIEVFLRNVVLNHVLVDVYQFL